MASASEEKKREETEINSSLERARYYSSSIEALNKEIDEINEEHVLVELARMEAMKEYGEIEAQRREMADEHATAMEEIQKKTQTLIREIGETKELETKLAITILDIDKLQLELEQLKYVHGEIKPNIEKDSKSDSEYLLKPVVAELEASKKELALVKEESFQSVASMDIVRDELRHVAKEAALLKKREEKTEMHMQKLNFRLLRAIAKLEKSSAAEGKAKSIVSNLSVTLEQLQSEIDKNNREKALIEEETGAIKTEVKRTETKIDVAEEILQDALENLKAVKSSESRALENLKAIIENTLRNRASTSRRSSKIFISKFEYEYLRRHAAGAEEVANRKVAAAGAWVEAIKASEREIQIESELLCRETSELLEEVHKIEGPMNAKETVEDHFRNWRQKMEPEELKPKTGFPSKAMNRRRGKAQRSTSQLVRVSPRSTSFTVGRRTKVMPNLAKFFSGRSIEQNL